MSINIGFLLVNLISDARLTQIDCKTLYNDIKIQTKFSIKMSNIPPPEIFLEICSFLSPADLFTLTQVCRKFREYLFAPNSPNTQEVWKNSRLQFMPEECMPPPEGMSEEKYVGLLMKERGCQFCKVKKCKIFWSFEVR